MKKSYPINEGWLTFIFRWKQKGDGMTINQIKAFALAGRPESDFEIAVLESKKTLGRIIFRKKSNAAIPNT